MATDERSPEALAYAQSKGAVLISSLLTSPMSQNTLLATLSVLNAPPSAQGQDHDRKNTRSLSSILRADTIHPSAKHTLHSPSANIRRLLDYPLLYTDILALVEQSVMARSAYFYGYAYSSVAGGVVNLRAKRGMDRRTMFLEGT